MLSRGAGIGTKDVSAETGRIAYLSCYKLRQRLKAARAKNGTISTVVTTAVEIVYSLY